jgi:hypothetical protein
MVLSRLKKNDMNNWAANKIDDMDSLHLKIVYH